MKVQLCKPVEGAMTEQEKCEAGFLYNPNVTDEMKTYRFKIQDAICEYNKLKPSQVQERRDFLAGIFGKIGKKCNILPPFKCDYGFHIEVGENFFANYNFIVLDGNYVRIGDNVWIGGGVSIIGGVTIGKNSVVAAGSVVIRDVPPDTLVAGNPARVVRRLTAADKLKYKRSDG